MKKIDWKVLSLGGVVASLTLAACGSSASLDSAVSSLSASQYLQVHVTATYEGPDSQEVQPILSGLSLDVSEASTTGQPLAQSVGNINSEVDVKAGGQLLLSVRGIGTDIYLELDPQALSSIANLGLTAQKLAALELIFDNRWFDVPQSLIASLEPAGTPTAAQTANEQADAQELLASVTQLIEGSSYTTLPSGGYSQTGTLASVVKVVLPTLAKLEGHAIQVGPVPGSYTIAVTLSGSNATGGSIQVTAPDGNSGNATVGLVATVAHDAVTITVPTGATTVTKSLIQQLEGEATSAST
jgi:hypothetical protein